MHKFPEYGIWSNMHQRCRNPKNKGFKWYGGRGINVCDRWQSFPVFYADMGPRPSKNHSIERVDNNLGYEPDNCIWATMAVQNKNRRARSSGFGSAHHMAKLNDMKVREIRSLKAAGVGYKRLADQFGVDRSTIKQIFQGETWVHVKDASEVSPLDFEETP